MVTAALAASGLILVICALTVARAPVRSATADDTFRDRWSATHAVPVGTARANPFVATYLRFMHVLARPAASWGCHPGWLTALGVWAASGAAVAADGGRGGAAVAAGVVVASLLLDGLDGAVALLGGRASSFGAVLDTVADRVADALWVGALVLAGGRPEWGLAAIGATAALESTRARGLAVQPDWRGPVTIGERPTRAIATTVGLAGAACWPTTPAATGGLVMTAVPAALGCAQLLWSLRPGPAEGPRAG